MAKEYQFGVPLLDEEEELEPLQQPESKEEQFKSYEYGKSVLDSQNKRDPSYRKPSVNLKTGELSGDIPEIAKPGTLRKAIDIGGVALKMIPNNALKMINGLQDTYANEFLSQDLSYDPTKPLVATLGEFALSKVPTIRGAAENLLKENEKEYKQLEKKLNKIYKDADLSETQMAVASGLSSFVTQAPFLLATAVTRNPKFAYTSLGYFGLQEKGLSYKEARKQGLDHKTAVANSNLNAMFEIGTELVPTATFTGSMLKYLKGNDRTIRGFLKDGATTMITETASENLNTFLQETNNALFGIQNELRVAWDNQDNPLYNGPTVPQVLKDQAYLTTISSLVSGGANVTLRGAVQYAEDVKQTLKTKDPIDAENIINQLNTLVRNNERTFQAIDLMAREALDIDSIDDSQFDPLDYFSEKYINLDLEQPKAGKEKEEKTVESFKGPAIKTAAMKEFAPTTTSIDESTDPQKQEDMQLIMDDIAGDIDVVGPVDIKTSDFDISQEPQLKNIKDFIVDTRVYSEDMIENITSSKEDFVQEMDRYRDLNLQESFNLSTTLYRLEQAGMPLNILEDLDFIGVFGVNELGGRDQSFNIAEYLVGANTLGLSGLTKINSLVAPSDRAYLTHVIAHELGHHLDYRYGEVVDDKKGGSVILPLHYDSPLFNIPEYTIKSDPLGDNERRVKIGKDARPPVLEIVEGQQEGVIIQEAFNVFQNMRLQVKHMRQSDGRYFDGHLLTYPLSQFSSMMFARARGDSNKLIIDNNLQFLKGEIFAQMHSLYYTNRELLEQGAPETIKLIKRIYDAIAIDGIGNKSGRLLAAVLSPRTSRSLQVPASDSTGPTDQSVTGTEPAGQRVGTETVPADGDPSRLPIQESQQYVEIGPLVLKKDNTYDGAPKNKLGKFKNTQKDFDNLAQELVSFAEQEDLSLPDQSRDWYKNALDSIDELTQGDAKLKEDVLRMFVVYSSQTPVETNLAYVLRSLVSMAKAGDPLPGFQPKAGEFVTAAIEADDFGQKLPGVGFKLQSFYDNMTGTKPDSVTMDTWMFTMLGFQKDQTSISNHRYGTSVIQEATRLYNEKNNDNMTPMQFQAVLWTYARNKKMQEQGKPAEYIGYETYIDKAMATVTGEVIPSTSIPELKFADSLDPTAKMQLTKELLETITTEEGKNEIMNLLPGTGLYKFSHSFGAYDGKINPNIISSLVLEKISGSKQFNKLDLTYADDFLRAWGFVFRQDAMPYFVSDESISDTDINDLSNESVNIGSEVQLIDTQTNQPIEMTDVLRNQINTELAKEGIDGFTQLDAGTIGLINFKFDNAIIENFNEKIKDALSRVNIENVRADITENIKYNTQYLTNNWQENPDGSEYLTGRLEKESIREGLVRLRTKVDEIYTKYREGRYDDDPSGGFPTTKPDSTTELTADKDLDSESKVVEQTPPPLKPAGMAPPSRPPSGNETDINNQWTMGDESNASLFLQSFREKIVNNFDRIIQIENKIEDQFGAPDMRGKRVSQKTDLFHGKVKYGLDEAMGDVDSLLKFLVTNKIDLKDFNEFLQNLHAPERNDYIDTLREPGKPGSVKYKGRGSGISTEDALEKLRSFGVDIISGEATAINDQGAKYLAAFKELKKFIEGTINIYDKEGLLEEGVSEDWRGRYKYYVPLVGFASDTREDQRPSASGKGMTIYGPELKKAKGRVSISGPPLEQAIIQRQNAVVRAEKNIVTKQFADLAREFPNPEMYEVIEDAPQIQPKLTDWNPDKGSYVGFKEDGKIKYVHILDERLARAFQGWSTSDIHGLTRMALGFTRYLSLINTAYNPEFMVTNAMRDIQTGFFNLLAEQEIPGGRAQGLKIAKQAFNPKTLASRMKDYYRGSRGKNIKDNEIQKMYDAFIKAGAPTGYIDQPTIEDLTKNLDKLIAMHQGKVGRKLASISYEPVLNLIYDSNTAIENAARFSVFIESINAQGGLNKVDEQTIEQAAVLAKNLTINFNRKGTWGPGLNATYMFFNAGVQGSVNFFRGFLPGKRFSKTKAAAASGIVMTAFARTMYNMLISDEDEDETLVYSKIPSFEKERNMIFLLPDVVGIKDGEFKVEKFGAIKKYYQGDIPVALAIPLPYGYNVFDNIGRITAEMFAQKMFDLKNPVLTPSKAGIELTGAFAGSFSPIGLGFTNDEGIPGVAKRLGKTAIPTYGKPFYEISINENWFGAPITREQFPFGPQLPESGLKFKSTSDAYVWVTKELNELTGGNDYYSGFVDIQPNTLQYFTEFLGGGALRTTNRTTTFFKNVLDGKLDQQERGEIPFARVFTAEPQGFVNGRKYFENSVEIEELANAYANLTGDERKQFKKDKGWDLIKLGQWRNDMEKAAYKKSTGMSFKSELAKAENKLKEIREKEKAAEIRYKAKDPEKFVKLMDKYEEDKQEIYLKFNKIYNRTIEKSK